MRTALESIQNARPHLAAGAKSYEPEMVRFLRDLIAIPAESGHEGPVIQRIRQEMERVPFDEIRIDGMGNILGRIGSGKHVLMMDSHTDTVGIGDRREWQWDPYTGKVEGGYIYGRGACDQRAGMASMVSAARLIKSFGLLGDYTLWVVGSVHEEDCEGLSWIYILKEDGIAPELVLITEPSSLTVCRGQRGRLEVEVHLRGRSCHASAPERGDNPIYRMMSLVREVEALNTRLRDDPFLGKGTISVTQIRSVSPSLCAVPATCSIHLDCRLTTGETKESVLAEIQALPGAKDAEIEIPRYEQPSYTGLLYPMEKYYPTWVVEENHLGVQAAVETCKQLTGSPPKVDKWTFSTNGVGTMGTCAVPTIGYGPGDEADAHTAGERVAIDHLVQAAQFYAAYPLMYVHTIKNTRIGASAK